MKAIMYHYVRPVPEKLPHFRYLHIDDFARQLDWFGRHDYLLSRAEFDTACETGKATDGVVLTFDDGLADHYTRRARPVRHLLCLHGASGTAQAARRASHPPSARQAWGTSCLTTAFRLSGPCYVERRPC